MVRPQFIDPIDFFPLTNLWKHSMGNRFSPVFQIQYSNLWIFSFPIELLSVFPVQIGLSEKSMGPMNCGLILLNCTFYYLSLSIRLHLINKIISHIIVFYSILSNLFHFNTSNSQNQINSFQKLCFFRQKSFYNKKEHLKRISKKITEILFSPKFEKYLKEKQKLNNIKLLLSF